MATTDLPAVLRRIAYQHHIPRLLGAADEAERLRAAQRTAAEDWADMDTECRRQAARVLPAEQVYGDSDFVPPVADLATQQADEAEQLQAIVDARPKTLDGKLIVDGMKVYEPPNPPWSTTPWPARVVYRPTATDRPFLVAGECRDDIDPTRCYKTREAAKAARQESKP